MFAAPEEDLTKTSEEAIKPDWTTTTGGSGFISMVKEGKFDDLNKHLVTSTSSGVHICISELDEDEEALNKFTEFLALRTEKGDAIDLVSTWTSLFLKSFGSQVRGNEILDRLARAVSSTQSKFESETNQLQCLLKVAAALQLHR